ncbi:radical SAM protein [Lentzea tibetensis]|uniref:Radical SAM protein n=1 Tax=Lentzea tibetensis TaxID=2591470 RepID=A0A563EN24_9PSEU|nr:radical SAM protein [Lentzea tibetensis]
MSNLRANASSDPYYKFRAENFPQTDLSSYVPTDGVEVKFLDGCNRACIFCVNEDYIGKRLNPLDTDKFVTSLFDWIDDPDEPEKPAAVFGTGGEPLMALDLVDAVFRPLGERGITTRLVTNGTLLTEERIAKLTDMKLSGVKVTFNTADDQRLLALMKGSHDGDAQRILDNIKRAKQSGLWVFVRIGMGRHNHDEVVDLYHTLAGIGVDVVQIKPWIPSGLAATNQTELCLSPQRLFDVFMGIAEGLGEVIESGEGPELTVSCYPPARQLGFTVKDCANVAKIYAEPCGHALICNFSDEYLGSWYPEDGGLLACVQKRREMYSQIMDDHGVASCPARMNWSTPTSVVSPTPIDWKAEAPVFAPDSLLRKP